MIHTLNCQLPPPFLPIYTSIPTQLPLFLSLQPPLGPCLVSSSLPQVLDNVGAVKEAAAGGVGAAQALAALNDVVVAGQATLGNAAESAAACYVKKGVFCQ